MLAGAKSFVHPPSKATNGADQIIGKFDKASF